MWQEVVAFAIVALTFGIVVTRRVKQARSGGGAPHCAKCPGWDGGSAGSARGRDAGAARPLIPASRLYDSARTTSPDRDPRAR